MAVEKALYYARDLIGIKYRWWSGKEIPAENVGPFYAVDGPPPSREFIRSEGIACTGLTNLMRRHMGLHVPGVGTHRYPGGTGAWFTEFLPYLKEFDYSKLHEYPDGTLLIRPYTSFRDQGHVAVLVSGGVVHSYPAIIKPDTAGLVDPGVTYTEGVLPDYYTHYCLPEDWLLEK